MDFRKSTSGFGVQQVGNIRQQVEKGSTTSGKVRSNKWKKDEQQVENGITTGRIMKNATSGSSQIAR